MNLKQALTWALKNIKKITKTPSLDAEVLLSNVVKKSKEFLYSYPEKTLTKIQEKKFKALISRRTKGEPVAYLTNNKEFYGLNFYVDKRVLVPRPETELLVNETIKLLKAKGCKLKAISDIGTGSGCIAISLAKQLPKSTILATDVSEKALQVAKINAKIHKVKIKFFQGDLLAPLKKQKIDIIIANLPYGAKNIWENDNSIKFEPKIALYAKKSGLAIYEKFFKQIADFKLKPKYIIIEIDPSQTEAIKKIVKSALPKSQLEIKKDLARLNRIIIVSAIG